MNRRARENMCFMSGKDENPNIQAQSSLHNPDVKLKQKLCQYSACNENNMLSKIWKKFFTKFSGKTGLSTGRKRK